METLVKIGFYITCFTLSYGFNLTILHTNDVHARFEQFDKYGGRCSETEAEAGECFGGVARRYTKIEEIRNAEQNVVLLDAGDQFQGTLWFTIYKGMATSYFMNKLKYDAMVLGNHEFDNKVSGLLPFLQNVTFPVISANIDASNVPEIQGLFNKSTVLDVAGEKIGVVGCTYRATPTISSPGNLIFTDEVSAVQAEVERLTSQGINKIIVLGHSGFSVDKKIAEQVSEVDIIVGGHTNTFLYTGTPPDKEIPEGEYPTVITQASGGKVLLVSDFWMAKYLGHLRVTFDAAGIVTAWTGNPILLDKNITEDNATLTEMQPWQQRVTAYGSQKIGYSLVFMDNAKCRLAECVFGNLIADALVDTYLKPTDGTRWTNASIGLWNSGGIRAPIDIGDIYVSDVLSAAPFGNGVDIVRISGSTLWELMEHSVSEYEKRSGRFLQVSGLRVVYDLSKPVGRRVVSIDVRCADCTVPEFQPLVKTKSYDVVTNTFLMGGGDAYDVLKENILYPYGIDSLDSDVIMDFIQKYSPIYQGLEGRIRMSSEEMSCTTSKAFTLAPTFMLILFALTLRKCFNVVLL
ncbi:5'-nucleotidase-like [Lingula anatina]|uniref:5'-nucleotidase n=1 Tax=Lingula anatina TaxID=7574 RepID=A0A1S3KCV4_LINAN|nr:5'-nucleotidase-like [Lingula anatina]|eukprot:XP_013420463.1 5'-nucleotidase-like [Lingula anatina]